LREQRAFSSGCIRVADPLHLADWVLSGKDSHSLEEIEAIVASEKTQTIYLKDPVPIFLLYWTAFPRSSGEFHFREDIYDRDRSVLEDLDSKFKIRDSILRDARDRFGYD
jgi:murein L,D-transpeptidase YcbB/YkuD